MAYRHRVSVGADYNYIGIFLTFDCPRSCPYCLNKSYHLSHRGVSEGEKWVTALNRLETDLVLTFNGGEPLAHPDFFSIVNGLREDKRIDLLTTLPIDPGEFMQNLPSERFRRDLPYPSIRVTYHPANMDLHQTIEGVNTIRSGGFDIGMSLVNHPYRKSEIQRCREQAVAAGIPCTVKPFLGYLDGTLYGQYAYEDSCSRRFMKNVNCRSSVLLVDPLGDIYRCHSDMFSGNNKGWLGSLFEPDEHISPRETGCDNYGFCHPCDTQIKFDRFGQWGYSAVSIRGEGLKTVSRTAIDWG